MPQGIYKLAFAVLAPLAVAASAINASASTILTDGDFSNVTIVPGLDQHVATKQLSVCASCGNGGGAGLQANYTYSGLGAPLDFFIDNAMSYNPSSQGAISSLNVSYDKQLTLDVTGLHIDVINSRFIMAIVQNGTLYVAGRFADGGTTFQTPGTSGYDTLSVLGVTASEFERVVPGIGLELGQPDFAGDEMLFGVGTQVVVDFAPNGATASVNIDNVSFTILQTPQVPLPAALPLFATGLGVLGLLGWRRKRKAA